MFGVVPKTLWSRQIDSDEKNRIPMAMRCLLITSEQTGKTYLIDNGCGTKFDSKFEKIYQIDYSHGDLLSSLKYHGFSPEDITDIVFTHLHFDHCGGTTYHDEDGALGHTFPKATYHVTERHWEHANHPNAREKASFLEENIAPIGDSGRLNLVQESHEFEEGFSAISVNGHTIGQQLPVIQAEGTTVVFGGDLIPTHVHLPLPWVMGYDMYPVQTLEEKEKFLNRAVAEEWNLFLEHDAQEEVIRIDKEDGRYTIQEKLTLDQIK
jgi:glyoxylase-like metal-dependent hydrolase (beta-lactamase superfamily II)